MVNRVKIGLFIVWCVAGLLALLLLSGCGMLRATVYGEMAARGNEYCDVRSPERLRLFLDYHNAGLRAAGAEFTISPIGLIICDNQMEKNP